MTDSFDPKEWQSPFDVMFLLSKVGLEKQVNRQLEMNAEAKAIKSEIASLNNELKELKK